MFGLFKTQSRAAAFPEGVTGIPLSRVVRTGPDMITGILGNMQRRVINKQLFRNIFERYANDNMRKTGKVSDLFSFEGGQVRFKKPEGIRDTGLPSGVSRRQIQHDLDKLTKLMSGQEGMGAWKYPAMVARQIGISRLISDLSILGVQAPMFFALNPLKIPDFVQHAMSVTKDINYLHWSVGNMDEISLYMRHGLRVGVESYLGGEFQPTWWLEHLPLVGGAAKGISRMNDIQFTRWMLYMKVEAIRNHMTTWNMINKSRRQLGKFVTDDDGPEGLKLVNAELGGRYLTSTKEETLDAIIRVVNNQLGGLARHQTGVSATRQAIDQVMLIVPGFARARAGLIVTALNKPHTIEGMMSASVLSRELLYAASASYMMSHLSGTTDLWNGTDPRKFDWLAAKLPGGQTLTLIPSPSIIRGAMRLAGGFDNIESVKERATALQSLTRGRLSPLAGAAWNMYKGEDFLGRKYENNFDAMLDNVQIFTPIVAEQMIGAATEEGTSFREMLTAQFPAELLGRSYVPAFASDKLDRILDQTHQNIANGRPWFQLTTEDKTLIRMVDPRIKPLEEELEKELATREDDVETVQRQVFDQMESLHETIFTTPMDINGTVTTQAQDDQLLRDGQMTGTQWIERYKARLANERNQMDSLQGILITAFDGKPFEEIRAEATKRHKEHMSPSVLAMREVKALNPEHFRKTRHITMDDGTQVPVEITDWDEYNAAKAEVLARYSDEDATLAENMLQAELSPTERAYREAQDEFSTYLDIAKYMGYDVSQSNQIDRFRKILRDTVTATRSYGISDLEGKRIMASVVRLMAQSKMLDRNMLNLALAAYELETARDPTVIENPARAAYIITHPGMTAFYDFLASEVPATFKQLLPSNVAPQVDLAAINEGVGF
jgi:hypothetical protein